MTATWTAPKTWVTDELVSAALMNTHLRDNLEFLKSPAGSIVPITSSYNTTSTSFVNVSATDLVVTFNTAGGNLKVWLRSYVDTFSGSSSADDVFFDLEVDGLRQGDTTNGLYRINDFGDGVPVYFEHHITGLSVGSHTIKLQWRCSYAGRAPRLNNAIKGQFGIKEAA